MNTTSCPPSYAHDQITRVTDSDPTCSLHIPTWLTLAIIVLGLRCSITYVHFRDWFTRQIYLKKYGDRKRLPIQPMISLYETLAQILFFILTSTNTVNVNNGTSFIALAWWGLGVALIEYLMFRRVISLGRKIIPLGKSQIERSEFNELSEFNIPLRIITTLFWICVVILFTVWNFTPLFVINHISLTIPARIGWICTIASQLFIYAGIVIQLQRCIKVVEDVIKAFGNNNNTISPTQHMAEKHAIQRMRSSIFITTVSVVAFNVTLFIGAVTANYDWYLLIAHAFIESCTYGAIIVVNVYIQRIKKRRKANQVVNQENNNNEGSMISNNSFVFATTSFVTTPGNNINKLDTIESNGGNTNSITTPNEEGRGTNSSI
jgi:hypothetical protein